MKTIILILTMITSMQAFAKSGYATVNGMKMYYETHGKGGTPLVMIHGGGSTLDSFAPFIPHFSKHRLVVTMEEQSHGRTEGRTTQESFTQTADDVAELMKFLKITKADVLGFSNGASSAMQLTIRHPDMVRKLIFASAFTKKSGAAQGFFDGFKGESKKCMMPEELTKAFLKVNPDKNKLEEMCQQDTARMKNFIDTSDEDVKKIHSEVLIIAGDQDVVSVDHSVELSKMLPKARLVILPGGHGAFFGEFFKNTSKPMPDVSVKLVEEFLK